MLLSSHLEFILPVSVLICFSLSRVFRFTGPQAELYQAVLEVQKACLRLCSPGVSLENIYSLMLTLIGQKLKDLGVLQKSTPENHLFKVLGQFTSPSTAGTSKYRSLYLCFQSVQLFADILLALLSSSLSGMCLVQPQAGHCTSFRQQMAGHSDYLSMQLF